MGHSLFATKASFGKVEVCWRLWSIRGLPDASCEEYHVAGLRVGIYPGAVGTRFDLVPTCTQMTIKILPDESKSPLKVPSVGTIRKWKLKVQGVLGTEIMMTAAFGTFLWNIP